MNRDQRIAARLAAHHEQMKRYEAAGYSRSEASIRAGQDMQIIPVAPAPADEPERRVSPTWSNTTAADLLSEERRECSDAIMALVTERDRYRTAMFAAEERADQRTAERDRYRAALARIAAHDDSSWQGALSRIALDQG